MGRGRREKVSRGLEWMHLCASKRERERRGQHRHGERKRGRAKESKGFFLSALVPDMRGGVRLLFGAECGHSGTDPWAPGSRSHTWGPAGLGEKRTKRRKLTHRRRRAGDPPFLRLLAEQRLEHPGLVVHDDGLSRSGVSLPLSHLVYATASGSGRDELVMSAERGERGRG